MSALSDRFWSHVEKSDTCWLWRKSRDRQGYGQFGVITSRYKLAHRVAWELTYGPIPKGSKVLHRCDNPPCVRPDHLFLGSQADNVHDMIAKGRQHDLKGEEHPLARLTEDDVHAIRAMHANGARTTELATRFHVQRGAISKIVHGRTWRHLPTTVSR